MALVDMLLARSEGPLATDLRAMPDLEARLADIVAVGRVEHSDLPVDDDSWARHLARHLVAGEASAQLASLRAADTHLVLACLGSDPNAVARLDERLRKVIPQALSGIRLGTLSIEELLQDVRAKLFVGDDGEGKIASYSGRGPVEGWLRVTVTRAALSALRGRSLETDDDERVMAKIASGEDPRLEVLRARCGPSLERAIKEAIAELAVDDRTLLRFHFVDALTIDDLASVYRLHRATVARRIARVRNDVFDRARASVMAELGLDEAEFRSLVGLVLSAIDLTLGSMLNEAT